MQITAKVTLTNKISYDDGQTTQLSFAPDYADGRNAEWAAATPALSLSMTVRNEVAERFESSGKYTLTFEPNDD